MSTEQPPPAQEPSTLPAEPPASASASAGAWQYKPPPTADEQPDPHAEYDAAAGDVAAAGYRWVAARVRGKKHKHDGTHCDDWFQVGTVDRWTVLAVSDGGGSYKLSRVGAAEACKAAVASLVANLNGKTVPPRTSPVDAFIGEDGRMRDPEFATYQGHLHEAMRAALTATQAAVDARQGEAYQQLVGGRPVTLKDLSATLLLAVHTTFQLDGQDVSFVMAAQVGDGMVAAVHRTGTLNLLGTADSGEVGGQTYFLTSVKHWDNDRFPTRTRVFIGGLRAVMVMTDGVADDYFPNDADLLRLYADLVLNDVIDAPGEVAAGTAGAVECFQQQWRIMAGGNQPVMIGSAEALADHLGTTVAALAADPAPLLAARLPTQPGSTRADRLLAWLDGYTVRGSFDDRTLVVLYKDSAATAPAEADR